MQGIFRKQPHLQGIPPGTPLESGRKGAYVASEPRHKGSICYPILTHGKSLTHRIVIVNRPAITRTEAAGTSDFRVNVGPSFLVPSLFYDSQYPRSRVFPVSAGHAVLLNVARLKTTRCGQLSLRSALLRLMSLTALGTYGMTDCVLQGRHYASKFQDGVRISDLVYVWQFRIFLFSKHAEFDHQQRSPCLTRWRHSK